MTRRSFTEGAWRSDPSFQTLCKALAVCKTPEEVANFLRDVGTLSELLAWSERFKVARQLSEGRTYRKVAEETGASTTTVTRVAGFLFGGEGGYRKALNFNAHHHAASHGHHHGAKAPAGRGRRR